jgi:hypothetical protein
MRIKEKCLEFSIFKRKAVSVTAECCKINVFNKSIESDFNC